ncbi:hypothetical protein ACVGVM_21830 [Pseudonocardia bannensis]|uniref:Uncharacterized protein n=1 Tax=Pseudonocardia bannensis TaxID=630973 RepID=A0A848DHW7_9PSEU|nr:hypothetical protein [Pseudonocardia bannensis]NMH92149.1 hypothetical protein [Pseudonocardia bannensis]
MSTPVGLFELLATLLAIGLLVLLLRWTYGNSRSQPAPPGHDPDDTTGDGLLEEVSRVPTEAAAQVLRSRLRGAGIRATIRRPGRNAAGGYRLLVFSADLVDARTVLSRGALE